MPANFPRICALVLTALCCFQAARAADPQSYRVDISSTGDGALDATLHATSDLEALRGTAPVSPFGLIARARADIDRFKTVLESYGYYQSSVNIQINGLALNVTGLANTLVALPAKEDARVTVAFVLGPLYHVRDVTVDGELPASLQGTRALSRAHRQWPLTCSPGTPRCRLSRMKAMSSRKCPRRLPTKIIRARYWMSLFMSRPGRASTLARSLRRIAPDPRNSSASPTAAAYRPAI